MKYNGHLIKVNSYGFYEISYNDKFVCNATNLDDAKNKIDLENRK